MRLRRCSLAVLFNILTLVVAVCAVSATNYHWRALHLAEIQRTQREGRVDGVIMRHWASLGIARQLVAVSKDDTRKCVTIDKLVETSLIDVICGLAMIYSGRNENYIEPNVVQQSLIVDLARESFELLGVTSHSEARRYLIDALDAEDNENDRYFFPELVATDSLDYVRFSKLLTQVFETNSDTSLAK